MLSAVIRGKTQRSKEVNAAEPKSPVYSGVLANLRRLEPIRADRPE